MRAPRRPVAALLLVLLAPPLMAQDFSKAVVTTQPLSGNVSMLLGAGGNVGVLHGPDGLLIVDDQYAPMVPKLRAALDSLAPGSRVRYVLNTHWHGDHSGGNAAFATETGAVIVAHENVRRRMSTPRVVGPTRREVPASPAAAWPVITFRDTLSFYFNGDTVDVLHVMAAHTDGDAIIRFRRANVVHAGDTFFNGNYPFIDINSGGSIDGMIANAAGLLGMVNGQTKVIPGHGPIGDQIALKQYHLMLVGVRRSIADAMANGATLSDVLRREPTKAWDGVWGKGFFNPETFTTMVYDDLKRSR